MCVDQLGVFLAQEIASLSRGLWVDARLINHSSDCDRALTSCYIKRSGSLQFVGGLTAIFFVSPFLFFWVNCGAFSNGALTSLDRRALTPLCLSTFALDFLFWSLFFFLEHFRRPPNLDVKYLTIRQSIFMPRQTLPCHSSVGPASPCKSFGLGQKCFPVKLVSCALP